MYKILVDTCVWLDLAKDPSQHPLLDVLVELIELNEVELIVPDIIRKEFSRNKERLIKESTQSLASNFRRVRDALDKLGDPSNKDSVIEELNNANHKIPLLGEIISDAINNIEYVLTHSRKIKVTDTAKIRAVQRGIDKIAPFHRGKNSINDALLLECFIDLVRKERRHVSRFMFVTHNKNDFSNPINEREPHPDFTNIFSKIKCRYVTKLSEALDKIRPDLVTESMIKNEIFFDVRTLSELQKTENELYKKVWFSRHQAIKHQYPEDILRDSERYASEIISELGIDKLGPWTDFEWGLINGKLSAIRWVMGYDWDMLDS